MFPSLTLTLNNLFPESASSFAETNTNASLLESASTVNVLGSALAVPNASAPATSNVNVLASLPKLANETL